ncbi:MAG TPA: hypothetical protein VI758_05735 [Bacteroidota bacterium]
MNAKLQSLLPTLASIAVGIIPVVVLISYFGVARKLILGWGVLAYVLGVSGFKLPLYHFIVVRLLHGKFSNTWISISHGLLSAIAELGAALLFFIFVVPNLTLVQLIGFGTAAGAVEALMLPFIQNPLKGTPLEEHSSEVLQRSSTNKLIPWMSVLERVLALFPHVAARGLVYISVVTGNIVPAVLAVVSFASIDGRAYFAHLEKCPFDDIRILGRFYRFIALIAVVQTVLFTFFYFRLM